MIGPAHSDCSFETTNVKPSPLLSRLIQDCINGSDLVITHHSQERRWAMPSSRATNEPAQTPIPVPLRPTESAHTVNCHEVAATVITVVTHATRLAESVIQQQQHVTRI